MSLVDYLAYSLGIMYVSDLRYGEKVSKEKLSHILKRKISLDDFPEREWQDVCEYLTGEKKTTKEEARQKLLEYLRDS